VIDCLSPPRSTPRSGVSVTASAVSTAALLAALATHCTSKVPSFTMVVCTEIVSEARELTSTVVSDGEIVHTAALSSSNLGVNMTSVHGVNELGSSVHVSHHSSSQPAPAASSQNVVTTAPDSPTSTRDNTSWTSLPLLAGTSLIRTPFFARRPSAMPGSHAVERT